ncbi:MAG TPA: hypothetical protein VGO47_12205 [Chlamydiales bacterium]|nr:hypothetical protein [Chlamydiales bacterium]
MSSVPSELCGHGQCSPDEGGDSILKSKASLMDTLSRVDMDRTSHFPALSALDGEGPGPKDRDIGNLKIERPQYCLVVVGGDRGLLYCWSYWHVG